MHACGCIFCDVSGLIHELVVLLRIGVQAALAPHASDVSPCNGLFCNLWNIHFYVRPGPREIVCGNRRIEHLRHSAEQCDYAPPIEHFSLYQ